LLILSFNQIGADPTKLMRTVWGFLNVENELGYFGNKLNEKINVTRNINIPAEHQKFLNKLFDEEKKKLAKSYGVKFDY
jgi:hypothetical protein